MKKSLLLAFAVASVMSVQAATPQLFFEESDNTMTPVVSGQTITVGYDEIETGIYQWDSRLFIQADPEMEVTCKFRSDAQTQGAMMQVCGIDGNCVMGSTDWKEKSGYIDSEEPVSLEIHVEYMDFTGAGDPTYETNSVIEIYYSATPADVVTVNLKTMPQDAAGIETVSADTNAPAVYYNLQGVQVANPVQGGIYIVRQGNKASKILF